ncbi:glycosyltransferase family 4 protein [Candidatus Berkelbacteria bacterium]|nr:glycosyltransferase family 4 protein [Candidatus Berkelbacteria bacterium]
MVIAIDAREIADPRSGKARYVAELVRALAAVDRTNQYLLYVWARPRESYPTNFTFVVLPKLPGLRFLWLAFDLVRRRTDVFLSPTGYHPILFSPVPSVLVLHDLAVLVEPRARPALKTAIMERLGLPLATRRASHLIAMSDSTKRDVERLFPHTTGKVTVVHEAAFPLPPQPTSESTLVKKYGLPTSFTLFVSTLEPRKNVDGLIRAYRQLPPALRSQSPLLLVGRRGWNTEALAKAIAVGTAGGWLRELGSVPTEDLPGLYALATAFAYPSWYEGFGLPPLEAMIAGTPVVTANTSSLPEVVGEAALTVDPADTRALTEALKRLLTDPKLRARLVAAGSKRVQQFSWEKAARETLAVLKQVGQRS